MKDSKIDPTDAHCLGPDKENTMGVTREVRDKGAPEVQHGICEASQVDTSDKLQAIHTT